jgi:hypothetical protein
MILLRGAVPIATSTYAWRAKRARGELVLADALADPRHIGRQKQRHQALVHHSFD